MKKKIGMLAGAGLSILGASMASAAVLAYEPMNYATGTFADGTASTGTGFSGNWTVKNPGPAPDNAAIVAGLNYTALPTANNALQRPTGTAQRALDPLSTPISSTSGSTPGTTWVSFLIQDGGNSGGVAVGAILNGNQSTSLFAGFDGGATGTQTVFGLATMPSGATASANAFTPIGSGDNIFNTTTHLIVLKLVYSATNVADVTEYVDPAAGQSVAPTTATGNPNDVTGTGGASGLIETVTGVTVGTISSIGYDGAGGTSVTIDELRVGDSFGDVVGATAVPEPTSLAVLGLGALGLIGRRRRTDAK